MRAAALTVLLSASSALCGRAGAGPAAVPLALGQHVDGTLTAESQDYEGVTTEAVPVRYEGGAAVAVVVTSETMDPFAILAVRGAPVGADAGAAGGEGACVVLDAPHPLDVLVYVSSAGAAPLGDFRVSVERATDETIAAHDCQPGAPGGGQGGPSGPDRRTLTV